MQSSGLVFWLVAVACACEPCLASSTSGSSHQRPSKSLLALVRATALHHHQLPQHHHHHHSIPPKLPSNAAAQLEYRYLNHRHHVAPGDLPQEQLLPPSLRQRQHDLVEQEQQQSPVEEDELQQQQQIPDDERGEAEKRRLAWNKRGGPVGGNDAPVSGSEAEEGQEEAVMSGLQQVGSSIASNFLRHARSGPRPYDVPRIDCPAAEDQMERFPCPSPDRMGRYRCIDDHVLCDGFIDCPDGEDEDRQQCMFYKTTKAHLDVLADAIIRWARGGK